jgi:group I intron endonuclease
MSSSQKRKDKQKENRKKAKKRRIYAHYASLVPLYPPFTVFGEIYIIWGPDGKVYVGQTIDTSIERFKQHISEAKKDKETGCRKLNNALNCHGEENFKLEVLLACPSYLLVYYEDYYMTYYNSLDKDSGYNLREAGNSGKATIETTERQSFAQMGVKNHNFGNPRAEETKLLLSKINLEKAIRYSQIGDLLPKYVKYLKWGCREGYQIVSHPALGSEIKRGFTDKKDGNDVNFEKCLTCVRFLDTLIPGDEMNSDRLYFFRSIQNLLAKQNKMIKKLNNDLVNKIALIGNKMI